eukprot:gene7488-5275_t
MPPGRPPSTTRSGRKPSETTTRGSTSREPLFISSFPLPQSSPMATSTASSGRDVPTLSGGGASGLSPRRTGPSRVFFDVDEDEIPNSAGAQRRLPAGVASARGPSPSVVSWTTATSNGSYAPAPHGAVPVFHADPTAGVHSFTLFGGSSDRFNPAAPPILTPAPLTPSSSSRGSTAPRRRMVTRSLIKGISPLSQLSILAASAEEYAAVGSNFDVLTSKRRYRTRAVREQEDAAAAAAAAAERMLPFQQNNNSPNPFSAFGSTPSLTPSPVPLQPSLIGHLGATSQDPSSSSSTAAAAPVAPRKRGRRSNKEIAAAAAAAAAAAMQGVATSPQQPQLASPFRGSTSPFLLGGDRGFPRGGSAISPALQQQQQQQQRQPLVGGLVRCVCNAFLTSSNESLLECRVCRNLCHPACVGVDHLEIRLLRREGSFVCPYCLPSETTVAAVGGAVHRSQQQQQQQQQVPPRSFLSFPPASADVGRNGMGAGPHDDRTTGNDGSSSSTAEGPTQRRRRLCSTRLAAPSTEALLGESSSGGSGAPMISSSFPSSAPTSSSSSSSSSSRERGGIGESSAAAAAVASSPSPSFPSSCFSPTSLPPAPRQAPLKLREVPDVFPPNCDVLRKALRLVQFIATRLLPYTILELPHAPLSPQQVEECLQCCEAAVADATLSSSYPVYCLKEVRAALHPYVQGALLEAPYPPPFTDTSSTSAPASATEAEVPSPSLTAAPMKRRVGRPRAAPRTPLPAPPTFAPRPRRVASLIFTNGMDLYGNLKITITHLKSALQRGITTKEDLQDLCNRADDALQLPRAPTFVEECLQIADVSDFVHVTLSATHPGYQGYRLATILFTVELLKWSIRGRRRAFLNMAIEKKVVCDPPAQPGGHATQRVEYRAPLASRRLYRRFGFRDVHPRVDPVTGAERWTPKEADMGRVMVNFDIPQAALEAAARLESWYRAQHHAHRSSISSLPVGSDSSAAATDGAGGAARTTSPFFSFSHPIPAELSLLGNIDNSSGSGGGGAAGSALAHSGLRSRQHFLSPGKLLKKEEVGGVGWEYKIVVALIRLRFPVVLDCLVGFAGKHCSKKLNKKMCVFLLQEDRSEGKKDSRPEMYGGVDELHGTNKMVIPVKVRNNRRCDNDADGSLFIFFALFFFFFFLLNGRFSDA